jgi:hypothetical protein
MTPGEHPKRLGVHRHVVNDGAVDVEDHGARSEG